MNKAIQYKAAFALLCGFFGSTALANEALWRDVSSNDIASRGQRWVTPQQARTVQLNFSGLRGLLQQAPMERQLATRSSPVILSLPMPDGEFARFALVESPVMEAGLAAKFPDIRTYAGQGLDDPNASLRLDISPKGFHAQVLGANEFYIDPYQVQDEYHYVVYTRAGFGAGKQYQCGTDGSDPHVAAEVQAKLAGQAPVPKNPAGANLRTYRIAIAATSSYTNAFGGTVADGIAGLTTMVNRLTGIYEREFAVRLVLVANNDAIVYTNSNVGPIGTTPTSPSANIQPTINNAIGPDYYDIGHAVGGSGGGGAIAPLGNVCGVQKAQGYTSLNPPRGDVFDIDFVAHELGHQLGGNHTWNGNQGSCAGASQWSATSAMEVGSGTTIMAYAGICGTNNLLPNSDAYFHARSFTQIWQIINNGGSGNGNRVCGTVTATGNNPPDLTPPANMTIPERTPFQLTASATDPNAGDVVTYNWEQVDTGAQGSPSTTGDNGTAPLFRSFPASTSPTRIFPSLRYILDNANVPPATITLPPAGGTYLPAEILPNPTSGTRVMNFRVTARDGRAGGGGLSHSANVLVTAVADVGPFLVGNVTGTQTGGGSLAITWSVASTDVAPVSTTLVNILISLDGGVTFETLLAATANDGAETVTLPDIDTSRARIRVEAANGTGITAGNTFFDITDGNFQIDSGSPVTVTVSLAPADLIVTQQGSPAPAERNIATIAGGVAPFTVTADTYPANPDLTIQSPLLTGNTISTTAAASCFIAAPNSPSFRTYPAVVRVVDSTGSQASAVFPINVSNNSIPTLGTYTTQLVNAGLSATATPTAPPADANNNQNSVTVSPTTLPGGGTISVAPNGEVSIVTTPTTTLGNYTVTVSVDDSCGARNAESFTLRVLSPNPSLTIGAATVTTGNAFLDPRECNSLNVALGNGGGSAATVVSAVLSSSTAGVTIAQANSAYPNIATDASQVNTVAYQVSTAPSVVCGTPVAFTHTVSYSGGPATVLNFSLPIGGPEAANYTFANETAAAPTGSTLVTGSQENNAIVSVPLPAGFAFRVYGNQVNQLRADTNGVLIFNSGNALSTPTNVTLPSAAYGGPALFALWDDLDMRTSVATGGGIYTQVSGVAPNRTLDIQWRAVRFVSGASTPIAPTMVFTARLTETSNRIETFYTTVTGNNGGASGVSATIGIQSAATGTVRTVFSNNTASLSAGQRLTATRAAGPCTVGTFVCGETPPDPVFANGFE